MAVPAVWRPMAVPAVVPVQAFGEGLTRVTKSVGSPRNSGSLPGFPARDMHFFRLCCEIGG